ncbi:unnamed protein product [Plutella xylostella]|uniref:(diamondback moth) hypothetical protein n=1 Tax=Plutella xylostella TaxID=51655 RepID=A0A8S4EEC8_PLUXY|nr:unnamed protein product [Plutella xylostella]
MNVLMLWLASTVLGQLAQCCPAGVLAAVPFVLEYAIWRGWTQAVLYTPKMNSACSWATVRLVKCLNVNGVGAAVAGAGAGRLRGRGGGCGPSWGWSSLRPASTTMTASWGCSNSVAANGPPATATNAATIKMNENYRKYASGGVLWWHVCGSSYTLNISTDSKLNDPSSKSRVALLSSCCHAAVTLLPH